MPDSNIAQSAKPDFFAGGGIGKFRRGAQW
jgi:hypothetical protein